MIQAIPYYNSTPEQRAQLRKELVAVVKGLGFKNIIYSPTDNIYSEDPLVIDSINVFVERDRDYFRLSTERWRSGTRGNGGKSVKIPIGTLINAPRIKRQLKEIVSIQKERAAAEAAKQVKKNTVKEYAEALNTWMHDVQGGKAVATYGDCVAVTLPAHKLGDIDFTVDHETSTVTCVEANTSIPRLSSYGGNSRQELELTAKRVQEELEKFKVVDKIMEQYRKYISK